VTKTAANNIGLQQVGADRRAMLSKSLISSGQGATVFNEDQF
jgi:hypothetical protein